MHCTFWENINKNNWLYCKNRHVISYMSVFFIFIFVVVLLSSFKPLPLKNKTAIFDTDDTIFVYDTVYYYDTTYYYDTIYITTKFEDTDKIIINKSKYDSVYKNNSTNGFVITKNNKSLGKYFLSFDFSVSPMLFQHKFSSDFIYDDNSNLNKTSIQEQISKMFGIGFNYHHQFTTISSGAYLSNYYENFNYLVSDYLIDTVLAYRYFTTTNIKIDTIEFFNIDSLLIGDTVIECYFDTTRITKLDSTLFSKVDSVEYKKYDKSENHYRFIEIPLIFSFNFYKPKVTISPQIGIITSFFVNSNGKIVSLADINQSVDIDKETKSSKINFSLYGGVRINYFLSTRFDFFTSGYIKRGLNSLYADYPIVSRFNTFGLSFGLRYKIIN